MTNYCSIFNNHSSYTAAVNDNDFLRPHISICENDEHIHFDDVLSETESNND